MTSRCSVEFVPLTLRHGFDQFYWSFTLVAIIVGNRGQEGHGGSAVRSEGAKSAVLLIYTPAEAGTHCINEFERESV